MAMRRISTHGEQKEVEGQHSHIVKTKKTLDPHAIEQRFLVTNEESSIIIGRKGTNVERVRNESETLVTILRSNTPAPVNERVLVIKGNPSQIATAVLVIARLLVENGKGSANGVSGTMDIVVIKFLFHKFLAGCVIGQGGNVMKDIQTSTNVRLSVSTEALGGSTEKSCSVTGTPDAVYAASLRIIDQLVTNPLRPGCSTVLYVPGQFAGGDYYMDNAGGYYGGPSAAYGGDAYVGPYAGAPYSDWAEGGAPLRIAPLYQGGGSQGYGPEAGYYPPPQGYGRNDSLYRMDAYVPQPKTPFYRGGRGSGGEGVGGGGVQRIVPLTSVPSGLPTTGSTEKIVIPKSASGAVIGRGGLIISGIKSQSGTTISIADPPANSEDRVVSITGPPQAIQHAIFLIRQRVDAASQMVPQQQFA